MLSTLIGRNLRPIESWAIINGRKVLAKKWALPVILISFSMMIALIADVRGHSTEVASNSLAGSTGDLNGIDSFIPSGYVLLPIEIQNLNSLDSIIGRYGVIDLYVPGESQPLARGIKIVRSPKNPEQFSVLVSESQSGPLIKNSVKPFFVIVQNPSHAAGEVRAQKSSRISIDH